MLRSGVKPWHLAVLIWAVLATLAITGRADRIERLALVGPDDYVHLMRVEQLLDGSGWFDTRLERVNPPEGISMHWSVLADLPVAGVAALADLFVDRSTAIRFSVTATPLAGLLLLFLFTTWAGGWLFGPPGAWMAPVSLAYAGAVMGQFMPGRIDHHGIQLALSMALLIACAGSLRDRSNAWAVAGGVLTAITLTIGVETLPYVIAFHMALGLAWLTGSTNAARTGTIAAGCAALLGVPLLLLNSPESVYFWRACDALSGVYLASLAALAAGWGVLFATRDRLQQPWLRLAATGLVGAAVLGTLLAAFPECRGGPYAALPDDVRQFWFTGVDEVQSGFTLALTAPVRFFMLYLMVGVAVLCVISMVIRKLWRTDPAFFPLAVFLGLAVIIAFLQIRGASFAAAFAVFAALPFFVWLIAWTGRFTQGWRRWTILGLVLLILSPVGMTVFFNAVGLAPKISRTAPSCALPESLEAVAAQPPGLVAATTNLGPMILYFTPHTVVGAPYHRGIKGLRELGQMMTSQSAGEAEAALAQSRVDYILLCDSEGAYGTRAELIDGTFVARLLSGEVPAWLEVVVDGGPEKLSFYRVREPSRSPVSSDHGKSR